MSDEENEDNEEIKLIYKGREEMIDIPDDYNSFLDAFIKSFNEDKNKKFTFSYLDPEANETKEILQNFEISDFYKIKKINCNEIKDEKKEKKPENVEMITPKDTLNEENEMSDKSEEKERIKLIYKGRDEMIDIPDDYDSFLDAFTKNFNEDKNKKFNFYYKDDGKKKYLNDEFSISDLISIKEIYCIEKEEEEKNVEEEILESQINTSNSNPDTGKEQPNYNIESLKLEKKKKLTENSKLTEQKTKLREGIQQLKKN